MTISQKILDTIVILTPKQVYTELESGINRKINEDYLNRCTSKGYVKKIIKIIRRSEGKISNEAFDGRVVFNVWFLAEVINYKENDIIYELNIDRIDKLGMHASDSDYTNVYIEKKDLPDDYINSYKKGETVNIVVLGSTNRLGSKSIDVIGKMLHYYVVRPIREHISALTANDVDHTPYIDLELTTSNTPIEKMYGYQVIIDETKTGLDDVDDKVLKFYKSLLKPFELLNPDKDYASEKDDFGKDLPTNDPGLFVKTYEILTQFDLIQIGASGVMTYADIDATGSIDAIKMFREMTTKDHKKDKEVKTGADFVFCYFDSPSLESYSKTESANIRTIISHVKDALSMVKKGGNVIIKFDDSYSKATVDMLWILSNYFRETILFKPYSSDPFSGERFAVCIKALDIPKNFIKSLDGILKKVETSDSTIHSIVKTVIPDSFFSELSSYNERLLNIQHNKIEELLTLTGLFKGSAENLKVTEPKYSKYFECQKGIALSHLDYLNLE